MLDLSAFNPTEQELLIVQRAMRDSKGELAIDPNQYLKGWGTLHSLGSKRRDDWRQAGRRTLNRERDVGAQLSPDLCLRWSVPGKAWSMQVQGGFTPWSFGGWYRV